MKFVKTYFVKSVLFSLLLSVALYSKVDVSYNLSATSNYVWRGMSQTNNSGALQGGVDLEYSGLYLGTWGSNISWISNPNSSLEVDIYGGYANSIASIDYDLGYIKYAYPQAQNGNNFDEVYFSLGKDFKIVSFKVMYSFGLNGASSDIQASVNVPFSDTMGLEAVYGKYDTIGSRYLVSFSDSLGDVDTSLNYSSFTSDSGSSSNENNFFVSFAKSL